MLISINLQRAILEFYPYSNKKSKNDIVGRLSKDFESKTLDRQHTFLTIELKRMMKQMQLPFVINSGRFPRRFEERRFCVWKISIQKEKQYLDCLKKAVLSYRKKIWIVHEYCFVQSHFSGNRWWYSYRRYHSMFEKSRMVITNGVCYHYQRLCRLKQLHYEKKEKSKRVKSNKSQKERDWFQKKNLKFLSKRNVFHLIYNRILSKKSMKQATMWNRHLKKSYSKQALPCKNNTNSGY